MAYSRDKLKKLNGWKRLGIHDTITAGKFKNCRVGFVLSQYPRYLQKSIDKKYLFVTPDVLSKLRMKLKQLDWENYLLK